MPRPDEARKEKKPAPAVPNPPVPQAQFALDVSVPLEERVALLASFLAHPSDEALETVRFLVRSTELAHGQGLFLAKSKELAETLAQMQSGPCRPGVFLGLATGLASRLTDSGQAPPRASVALEDGMKVFVAIPDPELAPRLVPGTPVVLDARATALLGLEEGTGAETATGELATFERRVGPREIEVSLRGEQQRLAVVAAPTLVRAMDGGTVSEGAALLVNSRQMTASRAVAGTAEKWTHLKHLYRGPAPRWGADDLAQPHPLLAEVDRHLRIELESPEIHRRYGVAPSFFRVLTGPTGTGKTVTIEAVHRRLRERIAARLGRPVDEVPSRAFFVRADQLLSKWLGDSEKAFARLIDEVLQLAREEIPDAAGVRRRMPVLLVFEEMEALGRTRGGEFDSPAMDRILGTMLQHLDPGRAEFREVCLICLATTNTPELVDPAFARRVGAKVEVFRRLNRVSFPAVLRKHVRNLPVASSNGSTAAELWTRHVQNLTALLFGPESEPVVELTLAGTTTPIPRFHRDFLTPSLVQRAVEEAAREAVGRELEGCGPAGVTLEALARAVDAQVRAQLDCLRETNAGQFVELPQGARVAALRRLPAALHPPAELIAAAE